MYIKIGNKQVVPIVSAFHGDEICKPCCFADKHGRSQRDCPRITRGGGSTLLCTSIGDSERICFVEK